MLFFTVNLFSDSFMSSGAIGQRVRWFRLKFLFGSTRNSFRSHCPRFERQRKWAAHPHWQPFPEDMLYTCAFVQQGCEVKCLKLLIKFIRL